MAPSAVADLVQSTPVPSPRTHPFCENKLTDGEERGEDTVISPLQAYDDKVKPLPPLYSDQYRSWCSACSRSRYIHNGAWICKHPTRCPVCQDLLKKAGVSCRSVANASDWTESNVNKHPCSAALQTRGDQRRRCTDSVFEGESTDDCDLEFLHKSACEIFFSTDDWHKHFMFAMKRGITNCDLCCGCVYLITATDPDRADYIKVGFTGNFFMRLRAICGEEKKEIMKAWVPHNMCVERILLAFLAPFCRPYLCYKHKKKGVVKPTIHGEWEEIDEEWAMRALNTVAVLKDLDPGQLKPEWEAFLEDHKYTPEDPERGNIEELLEHFESFLMAEMEKRGCTSCLWSDLSTIDLV